MEHLANKPKRGTWLRSVFEFLFTFKNTRGEILDHWISFADGFSFSSVEFYQLVEDELTARRIPNLTISRQEFRQGGMLSEKRVYLRMMRERLAFDACAAPFGNVHFFSCRTIYIPALVRLWHIIAAIAVLGLIEVVLIRPLGLTFATVAVVTLIFALVGVLRNAAAAALTALDSLLLDIPVVSTIYEDWFREETYYRYDTRLLYLKILPDLIKELATDAVAAKGVKLQQQYERSPIFAELYKPAAGSREISAV
jgi:hypothetical protein